MATVPPTKVQRDLNLDALQAAVQAWGRKEQNRLENEVRFMRSVLQGWKSTSTGTQNLATASTLLQKSISEFVAG